MRVSTDEQAAVLEVHRRRCCSRMTQSYHSAQNQATTVCKMAHEDRAVESKKGPYISQGGVATLLKCDGNFSDDCYIFAVESRGDRILKMVSI